MCDATLAMHLNGASIVEIMIKGRWLSDDFIVYIKWQVLEKPVGISGETITTSDVTVLP